MKRINFQMPSGFLSRVHLALTTTLLLVLVIIAGCTSTPPEENLDYEEPTVEGGVSETEAPGFEDDLSVDNEATEIAQGENMNEGTAAGFESSEAEVAPEVSGAEEDAFAEFENESSGATESLAEVGEESGESMPDIEIADVDSAPPAAAPPQISQDMVSGPVSINNIQFKANETGGTVVIDGTGPMQHTVRKNERLRQFIVEIPQAQLPSKLQRTLNTRDLQGAVGSVDAYQAANNSTRVVVQLREGSPDPVVTQEGNSLLIVASNLASSIGSSSIGGGGESTSRIVPGQTTSGIQKTQDGVVQVLGNINLADFMAGNTEFYGKRISIETSEEMEVRDVIRFIMDESGVNMVISEGVKGKMSLRLRQVPWDQALTLVMKNNKLAYVRQGNVIRIATLEELRAEEAEAFNFANRYASRGPLQVKMFPVNYAKAADLEKSVAGFLTTGRGKAVADARTNTLIITDTEETLSRVEKLITALDQEPPQVLIEGKIVEATEDFTRTLGVNWNYTGLPKSLGTSGSNPLSIRSGFNSAPLSGSGIGAFDFNIGVLDIFGNLSALLALSEEEQKARVLSSPRVVTMTNVEASIVQSRQITVGRRITPPTVAGGEPGSEPIRVTLPLRLVVTPQVTNDNSIIMQVNMERQFAVSQQGTESDVNTRTATTNIMVRNGETAVIGGIYQNDEDMSERRVPGLGSLPVIGWLFKSRVKRTSKNELVIFLTPRILSRTAAQKATTITESLMLDSGGGATSE